MSAKGVCQGGDLPQPAGEHELRRPGTSHEKEDANIIPVGRSTAGVGVNAPLVVSEGRITAGVSDHIILERCSTAGIRAKAPRPIQESV